jgi:hypothetical protein
MALNQTPVVVRPPFEQISPDKNVNCLCTTVSLTVSPKPEGFVLCGRLALGISAFYDISVRRLTDLPPASFRHPLASLPLLLASGCRHSAPRLSSIWTLVPPQGTFTPLVHAHAGRTTALVRTQQRLSVGCQSYLPPHNFNVVPLRLSVGTVLEGFWLVLKIQGVGIGRTAFHGSH